MILGILLMAVGYAYGWLGLETLSRQDLVTSAISFVIAVTHLPVGYVILFRKSVLRGTNG